MDSRARMQSKLEEKAKKWEVFRRIRGEKYEWNDIVYLLYSDFYIHFKLEKDVSFVSGEYKVKMYGGSSSETSIIVTVWRRKVQMDGGRAAVLVRPAYNGKFKPIIKKYAEG